MRTIISDQTFGISDLPGNHCLRISIESPGGGDIQKNMDYLKLCLRESLLRHDESPISFPMLYHRSLNDDDDIERNAIIRSAYSWQEKIDRKVFCIDRGLSNGMILTYMDAVGRGIDVEFRTLSREEDAINMVNYHNRCIQKPSDLNELAKKLNKLKAGNSSKHREPGDATDFRKFQENSIRLISDLSMKAETDKANYQRIAVRDSILRRFEAPISFNALYEEVIIEGEIADLTRKKMTWASAADQIIYYLTSTGSKYQDKSVNKNSIRIMDINPFSIEVKEVRALQNQTIKKPTHYRQSSFA